MARRCGRCCGGFCRLISRHPKGWRCGRCWQNFTGVLLIDDGIEVKLGSVIAIGVVTEVEGDASRLPLDSGDEFADLDSIHTACMQL